MRSSTLYLALIACVTSASATYTNGNDFFNDIPTCIKDCNSVIIDNVKAACDSASNSLQCICTQIDAPSTVNETVGDAASACSLKCSEDDQNTLMKLSMDMASSCIPYLGGDNSTSPISSGSMSGTATATRSAGASSTGGSMSTATAAAAAASGSGSATQSPSSTASSGLASTGAAGQLVLGGALLIPALLAGLMI